MTDDLNFEINHEVAELWAHFHLIFMRAIDAAQDFERSKKLLWECAAAQKTAEMPRRLHMAVDQFLIAAVAMGRAQVQGEVSRMGAWSAWALADNPIDKVNEGQLMDLSRLVAFRNRPEIHRSPEHEAASVMYFNGLFEFARRRSAHKEICEAVWDEALTVFYGVMTQRPEHVHLPEVVLGGMMLAWAAQESPAHAPVLAKAIEDAVDITLLAKPLRAVFCLTLATSAGRFSSQPLTYWANRALTEFSDCLRELEQAQMLTTVIREDHHARADAEAALAKMGIARRARSEGVSSLAATKDAAHTAEFVQPYFLRTLKMPAADLLLQGLQTWYQLRDDAHPLDPNSVLFTMPFGPDGSVYLFGQGLIEVERDSQATLVHVNRKMAEFLNTHTTVSGADNSLAHIPEAGRHGVVAEELPGLAEALLEAYCPAAFSPPDGPTSQLILPMEGHPIQATQFSAWNKTWPIASSLSAPLSDRAPTSVLLWQGGVISAEMELNMVRAAFERAGARVNVVSPDTSTASEFLREYKKAEYDVLWIASHGAYDHWSPHQVKLHLANDESNVALEDLWNEAPMSEGRRLLVLNVCDGARFAEKGMLPRIGLAAGLSSPSQATISHLWPVRPLPSAAFGAYLAHYVGSGLPYFDAYCTTLKALQKTAPEIGAELEALYGHGFSLVDRLKASSDNFARIETWGSAAFYQ